jgi:hypothetical protein
MPTKTKMKNAAIAARSAALPSIPRKLIDLFVTGPMSGDEVNAASVAFKKAPIERAIGAEPSHHLGYPPGADKPEEASNHRNGTSGKIQPAGPGCCIEVPRDREGSSSRRLELDPRECGCRILRALAGNCPTAIVITRSGNWTVQATARWPRSETLDR